MEKSFGLNKTNWLRSKFCVLNPKIKTMKKIVIALLVCFALLRVSAADLNWLTDLPKAQAQAKIENKLVLLDFTGSDWCGWCKKLDAETFSKSEFADYAVKNLVLVQLDYPNKKPQSDDLKKANAALQKI